MRGSDKTNIRVLVTNWFSSICFVYTCFIYGSFGGFYWVISRHVFGRFWKLLLSDMFGLGRIILGLVLLFFLVVFSSYFFIITCHIRVSFWVSLMYISLLTTISLYACLIRQ